MKPLNVGLNTGTKLLSNKILTERPSKEQTRTPIAQYYINKMELAMQGAVPTLVA